MLVNCTHLIVACLYCYGNRDVQVEMKRQIRRLIQNYAIGTASPILSFYSKSTEDLSEQHNRIKYCANFSIQLQNVNSLQCVERFDKMGTIEDARAAPVSLERGEQLMYQEFKQA